MAVATKPVLLPPSMSKSNPSITASPKGLVMELLLSGPKYFHKSSAKVTPSASLVSSLLPVEPPIESITFFPRF